MPKLLIAASGTGGHVFPALAVAEGLPTSWEVSWLGVPDRLEKQLVPDCYSLFTLQERGIESRGFKKMFGIFKLIKAVLQVRKLLRSQQIDVVFTTGGYIAAPAILGAIWCGLPVILHESNAFPGRVTRFLGRFCNLVALGLPPATKYLSGCRTVFTGTPVRASFFSAQLLPYWVPLGSGPLIVVMGGSQGALGLNLMVRAVLPLLLKEGCRVVHLTGHNDLDIGQFSHPNFVEKPFCNEIPSLLQHADLAVSRAGAGALSELAICNTPAILVPYPAAMDQHQDFNAAFAAELGAAVVVHQHEPQENVLRDTIFRLLKSRLSSNKFSFDPLQKMKLGMKNLVVIESEQILIHLISNQVD